MSDAAPENCSISQSCPNDSSPPAEANDLVFIEERLSVQLDKLLPQTDRRTAQIGARGVNITCYISRHHFGRVFSIIGVLCNEICAHLHDDQEVYTEERSPSKPWIKRHVNVLQWRTSSKATFYIDGVALAERKLKPGETCPSKSCRTTKAIKDRSSKTDRSGRLHLKWKEQKNNHCVTVSQAGAHLPCKNTCAKVRCLAGWQSISRNRQTSGSELLDLSLTRRCRECDLRGLTSLPRPTPSSRPTPLPRSTVTGLHKLDTIGEVCDVYLLAVHLVSNTRFTRCETEYVKIAKISSRRPSRQLDESERVDQPCTLLSWGTTNDLRFRHGPESSHQPRSSELPAPSSEASNQGASEPRLAGMHHVLANAGSVPRLAGDRIVAESDESRVSDDKIAPGGPEAAAAEAVAIRDHQLVDDLLHKKGDYLRPRSPIERSKAAWARNLLHHGGGAVDLLAYPVAPQASSIETARRPSSDDSAAASALARLTAAAGAAAGRGHAAAHELLRLASFLAWPHLGKLSALSFSSAGLYCTGRADEVSCFSCGLTVSQWTAAAGHPLVVHRRKCAAGQCLLIGNPPSSGNIPLSKTTQPLPPPLPSGPAKRDGDSISAAATSAAANRLASADPRGPEGGSEASMDFGLGFSLAHSLLDTAGGSSIKDTGWQGALQGSHYYQGEGLTSQQLDEERIKWESYRLSTFANVWTYGHIVEPGDLARNGFFYTGSGDRVQCAFCQGVLRNWELGDRADEQHAQHFTYCRFVQGHEVGNKPNPYSPLVAKRVDVTGSVADATDSSRESELGIIRAQPKNPDFAVDARRLLTFATWSSSNHVRPDTLAKAGFFFLGTEESVKCFFCDGVVVDWRSNVDPWVEHAQRFPTCSFLTQVKGLEFVQRHRTDEPPPNPSGQKTSFAVDPREIRARMDSPKVRILLQMDYPLDLVKEVVQKRLAAVGRDHEGPEELLADVFATHDEKQRTATAAQAAASRRTAPAEPVVVSLPRDHQPASMPMALSSLPVARAASAPIASTGDAAGLAQTPILESARPPAALEPIARAIVPEEENRQSKMQLTCKICMDSVVGIVFLPCGHLVCCAVCSPALTTCPICRVGIRGTVRTMF